MANGAGWICSMCESSLGGGTQDNMSRLILSSRAAEVKPLFTSPGYLSHLCQVSLTLITLQLKLASSNKQRSVTFVTFSVLVCVDNILPR